MAREMSGSLSKNEKKQTDKQPDFRGSCQIDGVEYWISGWQRNNERGKWISLAFSQKSIKEAAASDEPF